MNLQDLLKDQPPILRIDGAREQLWKAVAESNQRMVVLDDDPTGTQTVHDVRVLMDWSPAALQSIMSVGDRVFYLSTNSRSLDSIHAAEQAEMIGRRLQWAADEAGVDILPVSRSDSTLRGHYPVEVDALLKGMAFQPDAVILAPAFFEGGRYTVDDTHWVDLGDRVIPAHETEFARDSNFGYQHSHLGAWVEEKTGGRIHKEQVGSISLETIRTSGVEGVVEILIQAEGGLPLILNAACYEDLDVFSLAMMKAEARGKRFLLRSAASIVKSRGGITDRALLSEEGLGTDGSPGLIVVGSYVSRTTRQVEQLLASGLVEAVELKVDQLLESDLNTVLEPAAQAAAAAIQRGRTALVYTSRSTHLTGREDFLQIGEIIMAGLCSVVEHIPLRPGFVVAKGGITSYEVARVGLGMQDAVVLGQIIKGVPVWEMGSGSRWDGVPYVVYPGNVGGDDALLEVVKKLLRIH